MLFRTNKKPITVGACAVMDYNHLFEHKFTLLTRYSEVFKMHRVVVGEKKNYIWLPRNCVKITPDIDRRVIGTPIKFKSSFKARSKEQARVVFETKKLLHAKESFIVSAPTGFGKSVIGCQAIAEVGRKTIVVVPKEDLRDNWVAHFKSVLGLKDSEIGYVCGDVCDVQGKKVIVAMIQSLSKFKRYPSNSFRDIGFAIFDEVHLVAADVFSNVCFQLPAKIRIGYSATPERKDGKSVILEAHIGGVRVESEFLSLIPKVLIKYSHVKIPLVARKDKFGLIKYRQIPHTAGRTQLVNKFLSAHAKRNRAIVRFLKSAYDKDRNILLLSDRKIHLDVIHSLCLTSGIPEEDMVMYVGGLSKAEREAAMVKRVLLGTYQYASLGTNIPWLDTLIMATPRADVVQVAGRILREFKNKKLPVIYDIVDNDSNVLSGYFSSRLKWYRSIGSKIVRLK